MRNVGSPIIRGQKIQICHSLRCKKIDMSTADWFVSIFQNDAMTLKYNHRAVTRTKTTFVEPKTTQNHPRVYNRPLITPHEKH